MRLLHEARDTALNQVSLFLTQSEGERLRDMLNSLLAEGRGAHEHLTDVEFERELTVAIYDEQELRTFHERARRLIETGE